jgi:formate C-acetyltransferase
MTRAPKFGNDLPAVDGIAAEEVAFYCDQISQYRTPEGGPYLPLLFGCTPASVHRSGPRTGASADGRRAGAPLATSVNPSHGRERSGITAELKSVAGLDLVKAAGGVSFILDLHPTAVDGDAGLDKLVDSIRTFFALGGMEIGLNVLREEELRAAQRNPERYGHLMVRVFGFSAPFVSLDLELQEEMIRKTKHVA